MGYVKAVLGTCVFVTVVEHGSCLLTEREVSAEPDTRRKKETYKNTTDCAGSKTHLERYNLCSRLWVQLLRFWVSVYGVAVSTDFTRLHEKTASLSSLFLLPMLPCCSSINKNKLQCILKI